MGREGRIRRIIGEEKERKREVVKRSKERD